MIRVDICDPNWVPVGDGPLDAWAALKWTEKFCDVGGGTLTVPAYQRHREMVEIGTRIVVRDDGDVLSSGLLRFGEKAGDNEVMQLAWDDPNQFLRERIAYPDPGRPFDSQTLEYDERSGRASAVLVGYVSANLGPAALAERRIGLQLSDPHLGPEFPAAVQARFDVMLELCRKVAITSGLVFNLRVVDLVLVLEVYESRDLTAEVVFSRQLGTSATSDWKITQPQATVLEVGGPGEGVTRWLREVTTPESLRQQASWGRRIEKFYDNTSAKSFEQLVAEAQRNLATLGEKLDAKFTPSPGSDWQPGVAYRIGDIVGCEVRPGWVLPRPIIEIGYSVTDTGVVLATPVAGDVPTTSGLKIDGPVNSLRRDLSAIQRNR